MYLKIIFGERIMFYLTSYGLAYHFGDKNDAGRHENSFESKNYFLLYVSSRQVVLQYFSNPMKSFPQIMHSFANLNNTICTFSNKKLILLHVSCV